MREWPAWARRQRSGFHISALALVALTAVLGTTILMTPVPRLVWNVSASAPRGLYAVAPGAIVHSGDMVIARVPARWRRLAAMRRYIPINVPLVKRVAAGPGNRICAAGNEVWIDGHRAAIRLAADSHGRAMPVWRGCLTLARGQYLLLNNAPDSFDGRYFGPTAQGDMIGKARLLWRA